MYLLDLLNQSTQAVVRYFKPDARLPADLIHDEEMEILMNAPENSADSYSLEAPDNELEMVTEVSREQKTAQREHSVSVVQMMKGLTSIIISKENIPKITAAALLTALGTGFNFLAPYLLGETFKLMASEDETTTIQGIEFSRTSLIASLVAAYTLSQLIPNAREQLLVSVTARNTQKILEQCTEHLLKKPLNYHVNTPSGDMVYLIQKSFTLSTIGTPLLTQIAPTTMEIVLACAVLSSQYGLEMGLGVSGLLATYTGYSAATAKPIVNAREESLKTGNEAWENFIGSIARYKTIHDFGKLDEALKEAQAALSKWTQADIHASRLPLKIGLGHIILPRLCMLLAALYVGSGVQSGRYSIQAFTVLIAYLN